MDAAEDEVALSVSDTTWGILVVGLEGTVLFSITTEDVVEVLWLFVSGNACGTFLAGLGDVSCFASILFVDNAEADNPTKCILDFSPA
jgi:hypothetical protein